MKLTVFFEDPFWVGVFERSDGGKLSVCKVTFGAEPRDSEVYDFILKRFCQLRYSPAVEGEGEKAVRNPKRLQRQVHRQVQNAGIGTKSQQALQLQREQQKAERRDTGRKRREEQKQRQFECRQQKRKEKHRGR